MVSNSVPERSVGAKPSPRSFSSLICSAPMPRSVPPVLRIVTGILLGAMSLGACSAPSPPSSEKPSPPAQVYHVQLQLTEDKDQAVATLGRAQRWWKEQPASTRPPLVEETKSSNTPVTIKWKAPFYRVRLGPFANKKQAERVLTDVQSAFPDAFVAPSQVSSRNGRQGAS